MFVIPPEKVYLRFNDSYRVSQISILELSVKKQHWCDLWVSSMSDSIEPSLARHFISFEQAQFLLYRSNPIILSLYKAGDPRELNNYWHMCNLPVFVQVLKSLVSQKSRQFFFCILLLNYNSDSG